MEKVLMNIYMYMNILYLSIPIYEYIMCNILYLSDIISSIRCLDIYNANGQRIIPMPLHVVLQNNSYNITVCFSVSQNGVVVKNAWRLSSKQNNTSCLFQAKSSEQRDKWIGYFLQERKIVYETTSGIYILHAVYTNSVVLLFCPFMTVYTVLILSHIIKMSYRL